MVARGDFVEKTIGKSSTYQKSEFSIQHVYIFLFALLVGCIPNPLAFVASFILLSYFYMRNIFECKIALFGIFLGSLSCGFFTTYLYALGITIYFLSIHVLQLFHKNLYSYLPYIGALIILPYGIYYFNLHINVVGLVLLTFILLKDMHSDFQWIQKKLVFTSQMYGIFILSVCALLSLFIPIMYHPYLFTIGLLCAAFVCDSKTLLLLLGILFLTFSQAFPSLMSIFLMFTISYLKTQKITLICSLIVFACLQPLTMLTSIMYVILALFAIVYQEKNIPFHMEKIKIVEPSLSPESILKRQIQNFANIFESLSKYYAKISDVEALMLSEMAMALKYSADALKNIDAQDASKERILQALQGYQYEVLAFSMEEIGEGNLCLEMDIKNIAKTEIKQTLQPLLEVLTHEHLKITEVKYHRFSNGYHHIALENNVPFVIDAYADSLKNMFESSGDSFSIFRFRNSMICMISDGMGSGEDAATSSRLITNIFQRMVVSGIPKANSIKCINKLLQSDAYATLDVLCFDCSAGLVYIFKSAACPTFLIRDGEIYEVNGSSLPVGIISSIEPDCFVANMQEGDEYLMVSDGIFMDEIYAWLKVRNKTSAKKSMDDLMQILKQKQRLDDSTAVLSRVSKCKA